LAADRAARVEAVGITKRYGGVVALDNASVTVRPREVHGLVGANGAGKSTLVKCLTGMVRPTSGEVLVDGRALALGRPAQSLRNGIVSVPQELTVAPTMTVAENIMLGHEPRGRLGRLRERELRRNATAALDSLELDIRLDARAAQLPLIEQRLVMIARALSCGPRLAVFDEPTATLSPVEARRLIETIRVLTTQGVSILYVSHHLSEVDELCDAVTVLRDGRVVAELSGRRATYRALVELLASDERSDRAAPAAGELRGPEKAVVHVRGLTGERLRGVDVSVRAGEIVGLAGLAGSGARELLLTICGAISFAGGAIEVDGRALRPGRATEAVAAGVGFLPGDRSLGIFVSESVRHNVSLASLSEHARGFFVDPRSERTAVAAVLDQVALRADQRWPITSLSGGNQQKALVARWIASGARLLLLDDPTAGVDVATRPEIHEQIENLARAGAGILLVSTDVEELAELSHRVVVFARGAVIGELSGRELTPARVLAAMTGRTHDALDSHSTTIARRQR
jgi:monosaccharide-transporting ATPase